MKTHLRLRRFEGIEFEVYEMARRGISEGSRKKFVVREIARDVFLTHFPSGGRLTVEGERIANHIFFGGFAAAEELDWGVEKAVKHLAVGLLLGIRESGGDFFTGTRIAVRSAIQCTLQTHYELDKVAEGVIGALLRLGQNQGCNLDWLKKLLSDTAIEAVRSFEDSEIAQMERMLMRLLTSPVHCDTESCYWQSA